MFNSQPIHSIKYICNYNLSKMRDNLYTPICHHYTPDIHLYNHDV